MSDFHTIRNLVSQAINHRVGEEQFGKVYAEINKSGGADDIMRDRLLTVIIAWIENHEKEHLTKTPENATVK
jgi:hypothetical protein